MTIRRLLLAIALLPTIASPVIAATSGLLASVTAFYCGLILAAIVAFYPLTDRERERRIHRDMARNLSAGDPR